AHVQQGEMKTARMGIPSHRPQDAAGELHLPWVTVKRTRLDRGIPSSGDRGVEKEDRERGGDRAREHEPRRACPGGGVVTACHAKSLALRNPASADERASSRRRLPCAEEARCSRGRGRGFPATPR